MYACVCMCVQASACVHAHVWTKCQHHNALHMFFLYHLGPKLSHCLVSSVQRPQPSRPAAMPRSQVAPVRPRAKTNPKQVTKKILNQKRHRGQATGKAASDNKRTAPSVIRGKRPASSVQGKHRGLHTHELENQCAWQQSAAPAGSHQGASHARWA